MKEKISVHYKTLACRICGHYELPYEMTGKKVTRPACCPVCAQEIGPNFKMQNGTFTYSISRYFWRPWRKYYTITSFTPTIETEKQRRARKKKVKK